MSICGNCLDFHAKHKTQKVDHMNWKQILPEGIDINMLSFEECRNFKHFHERMESLSTEISGPPGFCAFYPLMHYLLMYAVCCLQENTFPALNKCWDALSPFTTESYDCEWLVYCWIFCDFPLAENKDEVLLDHFENHQIQRTLHQPIHYGIKRLP